jgi:hypothetical protein
MSYKSHNLRIQDYSLDELLGLFDLTSREITLEQVKSAKKRVLMLHPDKSRLGPEYFLFYKQALEILVQIYDHQNKQNQTITKENTIYQPIKTEGSKSIGKQINTAMSQMSSEDFQTRFNTLFEQNNMGKRLDPAKNEWFTQETAHYETPKNVSVSNLGQNIDEMKQKQSAMTKYQGVQDLYSTRGNVANAFDEDDEDLDQYVSSDPFSKLKFDDLRKVHKDQTVIPVSEQDFHKMKKYGSVDELNNARAKQSFTPLEQSTANRILQEREKQMQDRMLQREYKAKIQTTQYQEKNKAILGNFLRLT